MDDKWLEAHEDIDVEEIMRTIRKRIEDKKAKGIYKEEEIEDIENVELLPLPDILDVPVVFDVDEIEKTFDRVRDFNLNLKSDLNEVRKFKFEHPKVSTLKQKVKNFLIKVRSKLRPLLKIPSFFLISEFEEKVNLNTAKLDMMISTIEKLGDNINSALGVYKEHIKVLHNYTSHITTEITKLKIENEELKVKIKELEESIEFLKERERALEKLTVEKE